MSELSEKLGIVGRETLSKTQLVDNMCQAAESVGYKIIETNDQKPWGAYLRIDSQQADRFVDEFFPELSPETARLGILDAELSPKFLIVAPGQRLSWQRHDRRAERWRFLTPGAFHKSSTEEEGNLTHATTGDVVQFERGECHRLCSPAEDYVIVAEIWQHSDPAHPSDEDDIIRVQDDYQR